jgi:propionate CoA-transferase
MLAGCGGFINISQNAKKVVFCGTFTTRGALCEIGAGQLRVTHEGSVHKFVNRVDQVTFSGANARVTRQKVLYVTERAIFELVAEGMMLREIAPGVDLDRDILGQMDFAPLLAPDLRRMEGELFE